MVAPLFVALIPKRVRRILAKARRRLFAPPFANTVSPTTRVAGTITIDWESATTTTEWRGATTAIEWSGATTVIEWED